MVLVRLNFCSAVVTEVIRDKTSIGQLEGAFMAVSVYFRCVLQYIESGEEQSLCLTPMKAEAIWSAVRGEIRGFETQNSSRQRDLCLAQ